MFHAQYLRYDWNWIRLATSIYILWAGIQYKSKWSHTCFIKTHTHTLCAIIAICSYIGKYMSLHDQSTYQSMFVRRNEDATIMTSFTCKFLHIKRICRRRKKKIPMLLALLRLRACIFSGIRTNFVLWSGTHIKWLNV